MRLITSIYIIIIFLFTSVLQISCKDKVAPRSEGQYTVIVQFKEGQFSEEAIVELESSFSKYQLKKMRIISRPLHIYLYSFDEEKINTTNLIELLKMSPLLKEAQPNREVKPRN